MPTHPSSSGFERLSVYLSKFEVVFRIEAPEAEVLVREILGDPVRATEISPWLPLFDGPLHRAAEVYHWSAGEFNEPPESPEPCDDGLVPPCATLLTHNTHEGESDDRTDPVHGRSELRGRTRRACADVGRSA